MKYAFHPQARLEYFGAIAFYDGARPSLAAAFTREVETVIELICRAP